MHHPTVNIALKAARAAGKIILQSMDRLDRLVVEEKGKNDFVTEIDRQVEQEIVYQISKAFPEHAILGEEGGFSAGDENSEFQWVIDPLDGTTNFVRGIPHFAVSIACKHNGRLEHGVIYDPVRQEEFTATRGKGAQLNGNRMRVSKRGDLSEAVLATGIPYRGRHEKQLPAYMETLEKLAGQSAGVRRMGSAALDLAYVAAGRYEAFWETGLGEWDIAAGALMIQEAGGLVSDMKGGSKYLQSGDIVCGNPKCFKAVLQIAGPALS